MINPQDFVGQRFRIHFEDPFNPVGSVPGYNTFLTITKHDSNKHQFFGRAGNLLIRKAKVILHYTKEDDNCYEIIGKIKGRLPSEQVSLEGGILSLSDNYFIGIGNFFFSDTESSQTRQGLWYVVEPKNLFVSNLETIERKGLKIAEIRDENSGRYSETFIPKL